MLLKLFSALCFLFPLNNFYKTMLDDMKFLMNKTNKWDGRVELQHIIGLGVRFHLDRFYSIFKVLGVDP